MTPPFELRERRRRRIVGAFVLVIGAVLAFAVTQSPRLRELFRPSLELTVRLPASGSFGLSQGAGVNVLGTNAGRVRHVEITESGEMFARVSVRQDFAPFIREDSVAVIRKVFGVAGDAFLEITRGEGEPLREGDMIPARADEAPTEAIQVLVQELRGQVMPALGEVREAVRAWTSVADSLLDPASDIQRATASLGAIAERLERGEGAFGALLQDDSLIRDLHELVARLNNVVVALEPTMGDARQAATDAAFITAQLRSEAENMPGLVDSTRDTMERLREALTNLQTAAAELPSTASAVRDAAATLPELTLQVERTLREAEALMRTLRGSWIVGGSNVETQDASPLTPDEALR